MRDNHPDIDPPPDELEDEIDPAIQNDEQVFDELAVEPGPSIENAGDVSMEAAKLPDDLPGRADDTDEDLSALFRDPSSRHLTDGFTGSGDEDGEHISQNDGDDNPDLPPHPEGA